MDKKVRSLNFTIIEKEILLNLVDKYRFIIENKETNGLINKRKKGAWENVAQEYNATQTSGVRAAVQLKTLYEHMKKTARKNRADEKVQLYKTGGGQYTEKMTTIDQKV